MRKKDDGREYRHEVDFIMSDVKKEEHYQKNSENGCSAISYWTEKAKDDPELKAYIAIIQERLSKDDLSVFEKSFSAYMNNFMKQRNKRTQKKIVIKDLYDAIMLASYEEALPRIENKEYINESVPFALACFTADKTSIGTPTAQGNKDLNVMIKIMQALRDNGYSTDDEGILIANVITKNEQTGSKMSVGDRGGPLYYVCSNLSPSAKLVQFLSEMNPDWVNMSSELGHLPLPTLLNSLSGTLKKIASYDFEADVPSIYLREKKNLLDSATTLLQHGADAGITDTKDIPTLHFSCFCAEPKLIDMAVKAGAKVDAVKDGVKPIISWFKEYADTPQKIKVDALEKMSFYNADFSQRDVDGSSLIHFDFIATMPDLTAALVRSKIDVNARDNQGRTALIKWCYDYTHNENLSLEDISPFSVRALCEAGLDVKALDNNGLSALDYLKEYMAVLKTQNVPMSDIKKRLNEPVVRVMIEYLQLQEKKQEKNRDNTLKHQKLLKTKSGRV